MPKYGAKPLPKPVNGTKRPGRQHQACGSKK